MMRWAGFAGRNDGGGGPGAVVDPSAGAASSGTVILHLAVWEQWM
ncbi:hypothetical protein [Pseudarthrobacter enclensis]|uniref:Uncharacterized protein n=1 Tax=Pseudarthrobacter enclensis TaxID=993070 RepID=A0ABT9RYC5_9MICC|nr:hypothetical protein [Pseudarthrobacter enclensis]MDP9890256.1 hypothetical protein [Pseudarthrobacter enclensis]